MTFGNEHLNGGGSAVAVIQVTRLGVIGLLVLFRGGILHVGVRRVLLRILRRGFGRIRSLSCFRRTRCTGSASSSRTCSCAGSSTCGSTCSRAGRRTCSRASCNNGCRSAADDEHRADDDAGDRAVAQLLARLRRSSLCAKSTRFNQKFKT